MEHGRFPPVAHSHAPSRGEGPHGRGPAHGDGHAHGTGRLRIALFLTASFMVAELAGGLLSNSLALLADAGHMLTDTAALALSLFVAWFSRRPATPEKSYGYRRWEILAAFINGGVLLLVSAWIIWEALLRLRSPEPVDSGIMFGVAVGGLVVNLAAAAVLHPASQGSLNVRGAYLHVVADMLGSVGALAAALLVRYTGWLAADPVASLFVTALVVRSAWRLVRESVDVLLEATPAHVSPAAVRARIEAIPGVESVHDLHIWSVSSGMVAMSVHAIVREPDRQQHVLEDVHDAMLPLGIHHVTVQLERREMHDGESGPDGCQPAPASIAPPSSGR